MLKRFTALLLIVISVSTASAQTSLVGIGTTTPGSTLSVEGSIAGNYIDIDYDYYALLETDYFVVWTGSVEGLAILPYVTSPTVKGRTYIIKNNTSSFGLTVIPGYYYQTIGGLSSITIAPGNSLIIVATGLTGGPVWQMVDLPAAGGATTGASTGATAGDIKQGLQTADHGGWIKLDGRPTSTLTTTQQAQATALGIGGNLPDATGKVLKQKGAALLTQGGGNTTTISPSQLPAFSIGGTTGYGYPTHSHTYSKMTYHFTPPAGGYTTTVGSGYGYLKSTEDPTDPGGGTHTHPFLASYPSPNFPLTVENAWINVNQFIYLGQ